ncbi:hypothetical protein PsYK624_112170 [Phanerochaete sordida]|uniref:RNI-like protein n=1 Tax=Phanerochaete sordida TaxID=48140 RepID=A0A9P3LHJ4_9APHY|nr:hypothetical protein PsYK624_112170 [Phanerochaete sordida]
MHQCLLINEIAISIAQSFDKSRDADADLLHLALTCHAMYEPAMDALWAYAPGVLSKLLLCLPMDSEIYEASSVFPQYPLDGPVILEMLRNLMPADWARLKHHAHRVRHIDLGVSVWERNKASFSVPYKTLHEVKQSVPGPGPLLPNLRSINVQPDSEACIPLVLHSGITHMTLFDNYLGHTNVEEILAQLQACAAKLEFLVLRNSVFDGMQTAGEINAQTALLSRCSQLRHLRTTVSLTQASFICLASLTTLHVLRVAAPVLLDSHLTSLTPRSLSFPELVELQLQGRIEDVARLLSACRLPQLHFLDLELNMSAEEMAMSLSPDSGSSVHSVERLTTALAGFSAVGMLCIELHTQPGREDVPGEALLPLAALHDLRIVHLRKFPVRFTPEVVAALARAWPRLKDLSLNEHADYGAASTGICIEDLRPFAEHCPVLRKLVLPVAPSPATAHSPSRGASTAPPAPHGLEHLDLRHSQIESEEECRRIAQFLVAVFPGVRLQTRDDNREMVGMVEKFIREAAET